MDQEEKNEKDILGIPSKVQLFIKYIAQYSKCKTLQIQKKNEKRYQREIMKRYQNFTRELQSESGAFKHFVTVKNSKDISARMTV